VKEKENIGLKLIINIEYVLNEKIIDLMKLSLISIIEIRGFFGEINNKLNDFLIDE
jgi:hypothetical protein